MADVPYQGKDVVSKVLTDLYKEKSLAVYGINLKIKAFLPTELPVVQANDRISDHVFLLEDDSIAIIDYESANKGENMVKYTEYHARLVKKYYEPGKKLKIRIIVIYTCDVESANDTFTTGAGTLKIEQAFLSRQDWNNLLPTIRKKIENGEKLTNEEMMKLILLPLTKKGNEAKSEMIDEVIEVTRDLKTVDDTAASFALAAMSVALVNYTSQEQKERIKEVLSMTVIGAMFQKDLDDAVALTKAEQVVEAVDEIMKNGDYPLEEACRLRGINVDYYDLSKKYVAEHTTSKPTEVA